jgi:outer membrane protein
VPKALSGYRPTVSATIDVGTQTTRQQLPGLEMSDWSKGVMPRSYTISVEQPIFLGFRTTNSVKLAQTAVKAAREQLKVVEANTLLDGVTVFMDVIRAQVVVNLTSQNIEFLREQVRAADDRLNVGEGTRTDVAQTNARLQQGISDYAQAVADLNRAIASYIQVIGHRPESLGGYNGVEKLLPKSVDGGLEIALKSHPSIIAALYNIDVASYNVRIAEGATLPTLGLNASASRREDQGIHDTTSDLAQISGRLSVPLYQGGEIAANVRQYKETLGQRRIELDAARAQVRQSFVSAWGQLDAARAQVTAAEAQVSAQQLVLSGMIEERRGRPADDARRPRRAAGSPPGPRVAGQRPVHEGRRRLFAPVGLRQARRQDPQPRRRRLRPGGALRCGPRQVGRSPDTGRALIATPAA